MIKLEFTPTTRRPVVRVNSTIKIALVYNYIINIGRAATVFTLQGLEYAGFKRMTMGEFRLMPTEWLENSVYIDLEYMTIHSDDEAIAICEGQECYDDLLGHTVECNDLTMCPCHVDKEVLHHTFIRDVKILSKNYNSKDIADLISKNENVVANIILGREMFGISETSSHEGNLVRSDKEVEELTSTGPDLWLDIPLSDEELIPTREGDCKAKNWSAIEDSRLKNLFDSGKNYDEIAFILGRTRTAVVLRVSKLRSKGEIEPIKFFKFGRYETDKIEKGFASGLTAEVIAAELGTTPGKVKKYHKDLAKFGNKYEIADLYVSGVDSNEISKRVALPVPLVEKHINDYIDAVQNGLEKDLDEIKYADDFDGDTSNIHKIKPKSETHASNVVEIKVGDVFPIFISKDDWTVSIDATSGQVVSVCPTTAECVRTTFPNKSIDISKVHKLVREASFKPYKGFVFGKYSDIVSKINQ